MNGGSEKPSGKGSAYTRRQATAREQLAGTVNLVLTLTVAALAYGADFFAKREAVRLTAPARDITWLAEAILAIAVTLGIAVNLTRLSDFRWTARAARLRGLIPAYSGKGTPMQPDWLPELTAPEVSETMLKELLEDLRTVRQISADNLKLEIGQLDYDAKDAATRTGERPLPTGDETARMLRAPLYRKRAFAHPRLITRALPRHCRSSRPPDLAALPLPARGVLRGHHRLGDRHAVPVLPTHLTASASPAILKHGVISNWYHEIA